MTKSLTRVACVGTTHPHASARVRALRALPDVEVLFAADEDPGVTAFCAAYGLTERSYEEIFADDSIDAVLVHSKSDRMVEHSLSGIKAGKAVLVEKPGGTSVTDIGSLADAVREAGAVVQVGYNCRLAESVAIARQWLAAGTIGDVVTVNAHGAAKAGEHLTAHLNQPADMGGGLWVIGCHVIDIVLALFGMPDALTAYVEKFATLSDARSREDAAAVIFRYPTLVAVYDFSVHDELEWFESSRLTISGTRGQLELGVLPQRWVRYTLNGPDKGWTTWSKTRFASPWAKDERSPFSELPELANLDFFHTEARDFIAAVRGEGNASVNPEDAFRVARVIQACYESARTNQEVELATRAARDDG